MPTKEAPAPPSVPAPVRLPWLGRAGRLGRFAIAAVRKAIADNLPEQSAALAFITILSLVPLLAAFSFLVNRVFDEQEQRAVEVLKLILPYTEQQIVAKLDEFLSQAQKIRGFGLIAFLGTALLTFASIESSINRIWQVDNQRPLRNRLFSFTLVLFWGPLLIGVAYSGLYFLEQHATFAALAQSLPARVVPTLVTFFGLTMLYWLVPYTVVEFRYAAWGGAFATLLLEGLKQGFGYYIEAFDRISLIYGSFGLVLFFMISIQLTWAIVLLGSELTYCLQHFDRLLDRRLSAAQLEGRWLGLAALLVVTDHVRRGQAITRHEDLAGRLRLSTRDLRQAVAPLVGQRLLAETEGESEGYLLSCDPYQLRVDDVFELYEKVQLDILEPLSDELTLNLGELRAEMAAGRRRSTGELTVAKLLGRADRPVPPGKPRDAKKSGKPAKTDKGVAESVGSGYNDDPAVGQ